MVKSACYQASVYPYIGYHSAEKDLIQVFNATDLLGTMVAKRQIKGVGFDYTSDDYYETQVVRLGYSYKF